MVKKAGESLYEPEEVFRHMWETGMDELPRNRRPERLPRSGNDVEKALPELR